MNKETQNFIDSIKEKIKGFGIKTTFKEAIGMASGKVVQTVYSNGKTEIVDSGIEYFLCKKSCLYFVANYAWINFPGVGIIPFKLYYFQIETIKDFEKFQKIIMEKTRQCLQKDNFVMTNRGYISIKDVKPGDAIETLIDNKTMFVSIEAFYNQGKREICRILTNSGIELKCTLDHKIMTKNGWKEAQNLTLQDEIVSIINKGSFGNFKLNEESHAALIGYYLADGRSSQPSFVNTNMEYINEVLEIGKTFNNCEPYVYKRKKINNRKQGYDVRLVSKSKNPHLDRPILDFIKKHNLTKKSNDRTLTNDLMNLNKKQMSILLNRLFAGDGYITYRKDKRRINYIQYEIGLGAPNYTFIKQIEYILQTKYGIHCQISEQFDKRFKQRFWKIRIQQKKSVIKFINEIGIKGKTDTQEIINLISKETPSKTNQSFEKIRKIEHLKEKEEVYDITTESSNFLTNGLLVHNCGMSTVTSIYCLWRANFYEAEEIDVVSLKQQKAQSFVSKIHHTINKLPPFLKTPVVKNNSQFIEFKNGSKILSESQSDNAGRSDSLSLLVLDEASHYRSERLVRGIVASAQPTLSRTGGQFIIISCVVGETYIYTQNGIEQVIDYKPDNCKIGYNNIPEFKIDGIKHQQNCNVFYDSGITPTIKTYLQNGSMNETSEIHPYYIIDETSCFPYFKQAKNIKTDDFVVASCREKTFGDNDNLIFYYKPRILKGRNKDKNIKNFNNKITEDMAYFFGLLIGDGYVNFNKKNMFCIIASDDIETQEWLLNNPHFECYRENRKTDNIHFRLQGKYLVTLLKQIGFKKQKAKEKVIPKRLLQMSRRNMVAFLSGLFDADGHSRTRDGTIGFTSTSKELLKQIKLILDQFGIQVSDERWNIISPEKSTRVNVESYIGQITLSRYFSKIFYEKIGFKIKRKQEKYEMVKQIKNSYSQVYLELNKWIKFNLINKYISNSLSQKLDREKRKGWKKPNKILRCNEKNILSRKHLKYILDYYDGVLNHTEEYIKLKDFYEKDWYLLKINKIEKGKAHTYDFVIPETHSFYINGVIGHNTPNGIAGPGAYYYEQVISARANMEQDTKLISVDWWEVPDVSGISGPKKGYNKELQKYIKQNYYHNPGVKKAAKIFFDPISEEEWRDNPWLKKQMDDLQEVIYKQEVLHNFIVGEHQVFNEDILNRVQKETKEPMLKNKLGNIRIDNLWIWKNPIPKHRYILGCLPPGEKVLTDNGLKDIEKITFNDKLINKDGNFTNIENIQKYKVNENVYEFKVVGILRKTKFTAEHPILASNHIVKRKHDKPRYIDFDFKFKKVSTLKKGDWLIYPNVYRKNILSNKEILKHWDIFSGRKDFDLDKNIILDKDFWWFIGIWLAEGWTQNRQYSKSIHTCHNFKKEFEYVDKIKKLFEKYNRKVGIKIKKERNVVETHFNSSQLFKFLNKNFGKCANKKFIAEWIKYLPEDFKIKLIKGYLNGDGSIFKTKKTYYNTSFVSVSFNLLESIQDILFSIGLVSSLSILRKEGETIFPGGKICKTKETYQLKCGNLDSINLMEKLNIPYDKFNNKEKRRKICKNFISDDLKYIYLRVNEIVVSPYNGNVYNFETGSHNYLCKYLTTHNCDVSTGTGKDSSSIQVMDVETYEQVAEYKGFISTKLFGRFVKAVAKYYNQAFVVIECNGVGEAVFNEVYYHDNDPYQNVFKQLKKKNNMSRMTGWITDTKTRKLLTNELIDWFVVDELWNEFKVYSKRVHYEMSTWIWDGIKPDHTEGCVSGNTLIETVNGVKPISEIKYGDLVLTHNGRFKPVKKTFKFKDDSKKMLKIQSFGKIPLYITSNHKFYIYDKNTKGFYFENFDNIYNYNNYKSNGIFSNEIKDLNKIDLIEYNKNFKTDDSFIYWINKKGEQKIKRNIEIDNIFLFFVGHVLADGTISKKGSITITTSSNEFDIYKEYSNYFKRYGVEIFINKLKDTNYKRFSINNIILWNFFKKIGISENKKTLEIFRYLQPEKQMYILMGYLFGDGCFNKEKQTFTAASISSNLMFFICSILYRNNINFNMSHHNGRNREKSVCKEQFRVSIIKESALKIINNDLFYLFKKYKNNCENIIIPNKTSNQREKLQIIDDGFTKSSFRTVEKVKWDDYFYDIEVEDDHSYVANGYIVHNSHDDTLIALALAIYLRNKVEEAGESFLITENGSMVEYNSKDNNENNDEWDDSKFDLFFGEEEEENIIEKRHGMKKEDYDWLVGRT